MNDFFSKQELERYSRHLLIPEFNLEGQTKLKKAKVLVIGSGGLGSPVLMYLSAAGVGKIGIVDFDLVDVSNLQRQVIFSGKDIGKPKAKSAIVKLQDLNPHVEFTAYQERISAENAISIISDWDIVIDGTDNFPTRYLVNDACVILNKPNIYGSIFRFEGQVSVFNLDLGGKRGPNYRDLFPIPPDPGTVPSCSEGGVFGVLPGIIGSMQANEAIKVITGIGKPLSGRLFVFDTLNFESRTLKFSNNPNAPKITELINYEEFCGFEQKPDIKELSVNEFQNWQGSKKTYQLIDVRSKAEYDIVNIDGLNIPLSNIQNQFHQIVRDKPVVLHCKTGKRSIQAIKWLEENQGFTNLFNLSGGIVAWTKEVQPTLISY